MRHKRFATMLAIIALACSLAGAGAQAQTTLEWIALARSSAAASSAPVPAQCPPQPVATGLRAPAKLIFTQHGNLLVAEAGNGPNTGRLSLVDPATGQRRTLLDGLPAGFAPPGGEPSGPSGLAMRGRTLYLTIGAGDSVIPGAIPGTEIPNPNRSSALFSSVLAVDFTPHVEQTTAGFNLTFADQQALQNGAEVVLSNGGGDKIKVRLVTDFPDYQPEPRPGEPNNVRPSNPFGLVVIANHLYVADAARNSVRKVALETGATSVLASFAPLPNPLPFGPPVVEAVPDSIRLYGEQLLVTFLTGFPFPQGSAQVRLVDPATGSHAPFITGLTTAIDVLPVGGRGRTSEFLTLEFSANMLMGAPGRLSRYAAPAAAPVVIAACLVTPTSLARDERTGEIYITQIFPGQIVKVAAP